MPEWAKGLENWGREMERKYGGSPSCHPEPGEGTGTENLDSSCCQNDDNKKSEWKGRINPVGDIVGQFISYLVITYVPVYFPGFFLDGWSAVYTVLFYSILVHVAVDVVLIVLQAKPFYYLGQVITNIAGIVAMVTMVTIFPFNFPGTVGSIVQFALWVAIVVVSIVTFFDFFKIFSPDWE